MEITVAFIILMIALVPLSYLMTNLLGQAAYANQHVAANQLAESWLEQLANQDLTPSQVQGNWTAQPNSTIGGVTYTVNTNLNLVPTSGLSRCQAGASPQVVTAIARVTWGAGSSHVVSDTTEFNPTSQVVDPSKGFLALPVFGYDTDDAGGHTLATRVSAIPVTITGPAPLTNAVTVSPDSSGCVFEELTAGTYTVQLSQPASYPQFQDFPLGTTTSETVTILVQQTTLATGLYFDEGSTIQPANSPAVTTVDNGTTCLTGASSCVIAGESAPTPGASAGSLFAGSGTAWNQVTVPAGVTRLNAEACVSATKCFAVGSGTAGAVVVSYDPSAGTAGLVSSSVGADVLSQIVCTSAPTCVATGVDATGAPVAATYAGSPASWTFPATVLPSGPTGVAAITGVGCATVSCVVVGLNSGGQAVALSETIATSAWAATATPFPANVAHISQIACTLLTCVASGTDTSANPVYSTYDDTSSTWSATTTPYPAPLATVTQLSCTPTLCLATGADGTGVPLFTTYPTASWTTPIGFPAGVVSVTQFTCPTDTHCFAIGNNGTSASVLEYSSGAWASDAIGVTSPTYVPSVGCTSVTACYVSGIAADGNPEVLVDQSGSWSAVTLGTSIPVNASTVNTVDLMPASGSPVVQGQVPPIYYPNPTGYYLWAGDGNVATVGSCAASPPQWITPVIVTPGATTNASPAMAPLAIEVVDPTGAILSGATVTATRTSCTGEGNVWPGAVTTGSDGEAVIGAPPGTYAVAVTAGAQTGSGTVTVNQSGTVSPVRITAS